MTNLRCFATISIIALLHAACAVDPAPGGSDEDPGVPPSAGEIVERYARTMCIDDFRTAGMAPAWEVTKMYPHEAAFCSSCHGQGQDGFLAPSYSILDPVQRERAFFDGLKGKQELLSGYVVPAVDAAGGFTMVVNRAGLDKVAAGMAGHERFVLDDEPGFPALQRFHDLTMQRLASGPPCGPLQ